MCRGQCLHASLVEYLMQCTCTIGSKSVAFNDSAHELISANVYTSGPIGCDANFSTPVQLLGTLHAAQLMHFAMLQEKQL